MKLDGVEFVAPATPNPPTNIATTVLSAAQRARRNTVLSPRCSTAAFRSAKQSDHIHRQRCAVCEKRRRYGS